MTHTPEAREFLRIMAERRAFPRNTPDHDYRTRAARRLVWLMKGVAAAVWPQ